MPVGSLRLLAWPAKGRKKPPHHPAPERTYDETAFLAKVQQVVDRVGWCVVVASEGIRSNDGRFVADAGGTTDAFGHTQLGGVAAYLASRVKQALGLKVHWTLPDYLQTLRKAHRLQNRLGTSTGCG